MASRLRINDRCHWHGWLPRNQSLAVMRTSHVFVITSLKDLFHLACPWSAWITAALPIS
jgi:hypothetical protein